MSLTDPKSGLSLSHHAAGDRPPADVPVFDCHVFLSPPNEQGLIVGRVASLPEIVCQGTNERDVLRQIVSDFKRALIRYRDQGQAIPWADPPALLTPGERERWLPVHL